MTVEERDQLFALGAKCKDKGCRCRNRCYYIWNRYWSAKATICTHPNSYPADDANNYPPVPGVPQCSQVPIGKLVQDNLI